MEALARGEIVLFPFPYTDMSQSKLRPCLVLSSEMGEDVILCQITSQRSRRDAFAIELKRNETLGGSLEIDSYIRANMIFTADKLQIRARFCRVNNHTYQRVVDTITKIINNSQSMN